ncbi:hypothetical protein [Bradymonas sediminis]|uniref:hypothetical protein n=1 Tax=Bradymonas sediminis TaxID=1548548 RepID=UPI0010621C99|nr:hypothetical protein [Bradymonas sediminis]
MGQREKLIDIEKVLQREFCDVSIMGGNTLWVHSSVLSAYVQRAAELGCVILGMDGARIYDDATRPDLDLIFITSSESVAASEAVEEARETAELFILKYIEPEENLYFDVVLRCK